MSEADFTKGPLGSLAIAVGLLYWPLESLIHAFVFREASLADSFLSPSVDEAWMRLLISATFILFGIYTNKSMGRQLGLIEQIREQEARSRRVIETAHDAYVCIDADGNIIDWNPKAEDMFGWSRQKVMGEPLAETIIPERFREKHRHGLAHYLASGSGPWLYKTVRTTAQHRDGYELPIEMAIVPLVSGGKKEFYAFIRVVIGESR